MDAGQEPLGLDESHRGWDLYLQPAANQRAESEDEQRRGELAAEEGGLQIRADQLVEFGLAHSTERSPEEGRRVVHQQIDATFKSDEFAHGRFDRLIAGDVLLKEISETGRILYESLHA